MCGLHPPGLQQGSPSKQQQRRCRVKLLQAAPGGAPGAAAGAAAACARRRCRQCAAPACWCWKCHSCQILRHQGAACASRPRECCWSGCRRCCRCPAACHRLHCCQEPTRHDLCCCWCCCHHRLQLPLPCWAPPTQPLAGRPAAAPQVPPGAPWPRQRSCAAAPCRCWRPAGPAPTSPPPASRLSNRAPCTWPAGGRAGRGVRRSRRARREARNACPVAAGCCCCYPAA